MFSSIRRILHPITDTQTKLTIATIRRSKRNFNFKSKDPTDPSVNKRVIIGKNLPLKEISGISYIETTAEELWYYILGLMLHKMLVEFVKGGREEDVEITVTTVVVAVGVGIGIGGDVGVSTSGGCK